MVIRVPFFHAICDLNFLLSLKSFVPSFSPPEKPSYILQLKEGQYLHWTHMEEAAQLMMTQFGCLIEVVRDTSTAGFRIQEGQVTLLLAETQGKIGHWVCLQFLYGSHKIQIYDSCCSTNQTTWNKDLRKAVKRLFGNAFSSKLMSSPQQEGDKHCGLFAITNALYIFKGLDLPLRYDQTQMLHHLKMCTKNKFLEPFPG